MRYQRISRRLVPAAVVTTALAGTLLLGHAALREEPRAARTGPGTLSRRGPAPAAVEDLEKRLAVARRRHDVRETTWLLHEVGRVGAAKGRALLLELAHREDADPAERLAAVSALGRAGDEPALSELASTCSSSLVQAKVRAVRAGRTAHAR